MRIATAVLIAHHVGHWPEPVIEPTVPLGKRYRVDLDSEGIATLHNTVHPEWGTLCITALLDVDDGFPLPRCCLRIESAHEELN